MPKRPVENPDELGYFIAEECPDCEGTGERRSRQRRMGQCRVSHWVVIAYERVEVTSHGHGAEFVPGSLFNAAVVTAEDEDAAIREAANGPGFYAAFPLPNDLKPRELSFSLEGPE